MFDASMEGRKKKVCRRSKVGKRMLMRDEKSGQFCKKKMAKRSKSHRKSARKSRSHSRK